MAIKAIHYKGYEFRLSYVLHNLDKASTITFLHGWGSNKELMFNCFKLFFNDYKHIYIDLPGFGKSTCNTVLNTQDYANIIDILLSELNLCKTLMVGHSFGGKVALMLNPEHLILLSTAGILRQKSWQVQAKIKMAKLLKILGLKNLTNYFRSTDVKGMNQTMYQIFKIVVDEDFSKHFTQYKKLCSIFWGKNDDTTPLESALIIDQLMPKAHLEVINGDHYFFLKTAQFIEQKVYEYKTSEVLNNKASTA